MPKNKKTKFIKPGRRVMDMAWLRQGNIIYTGEAMMLACLLHVKGDKARPTQDVKQIAEMLDDPNL